MANIPCQMRVVNLDKSTKNITVQNMRSTWNAQLIPTCPSRVSPMPSGTAHQVREVYLFMNDCHYNCSNNYLSIQVLCSVVQNQNTNSQVSGTMVMAAITRGQTHQSTVKIMRAKRLVDMIILSP